MYRPSVTPSLIPKSGSPSCSSWKCEKTHVWCRSCYWMCARTQEGAWGWGSCEAEVWMPPAHPSELILWPRITCFPINMMCIKFSKLNFFQKWKVHTYRLWRLILLSFLQILWMSKECDADTQEGILDFLGQAAHIQFKTRVVQIWFKIFVNACSNLDLTLWCLNFKSYIAQI